MYVCEVVEGTCAAKFLMCQAVLSSTFTFFNKNTFCIIVSRVAVWTVISVCLSIDHFGPD